MQIRIQIVREAAAAPRKSRRRLLRLSTVAALALAVFAPPASADHTFADVPTGNQAHGAADRVYQAGLMTACETTPQLRFCPFTEMIRMGGALQYDRLLGLDGNPRPFTPTWRAVNIVTGGAGPPFTVDSGQKVANLNADLLDGKDSSDFAPAYPRVFSVFGTGPFTIHTETDWVLETTAADTIRLRLTNSFASFGFEYPDPSCAQPRSMISRNATVGTVGATLVGTLCGPGSSLTVNVIDYSGSGGGSSFAFRCWRTHANANRCVREL